MGKTRIFASFFLHNKKTRLLLTVSRGSLHKKIPLDLVYIDKDDVLIRFFRDIKVFLAERRYCLVKPN